MKLTFYRMATTLGGPFIRYYLGRRLKVGKENSERFPERLGIASLPRPKGKVIWVHAASVGEALSTLPVIDYIHQHHNDWQVLVTTGTVTSARLMLERLPANARHQFVPVDRVSYVRRFLEHWKPDLALWVESEFWPNLVIESRASAVPMVVLNGRMSQRSFIGWSKHKSMIRRLMSAFRLVLAQSEMDGERFTTLGAKNVVVPGNLKFSAPPLPVDIDAMEALALHIKDRPVWLASSTHAGEEALCASVHIKLKDKIKDVLTIIVPRHPERGVSIANELIAMGLNVATRSKGDVVTPNCDVYIADTLGELGLFYRLCSLVFIGKTLVNGGGQNPIEPALLHCALIFGPDMSNFNDVATRLVDAGGALTVQNENELHTTLDRLLCDAHECTKMTEVAHKIATSESHVLDHVMNELTPFLKRLKDT